MDNYVEVNMAVYKLYKNGNFINTIHASNLPPSGDYYDSIEEVIDSYTEPVQAIIGITSNNVRDGLTLAEKVKWDNNMSPSIITAKLEFKNKLSVSQATEILQFLVTSEDISQSSVDKILLLSS